MFYTLRIGAGIILRRYTNNYRADEYLVGDKAYATVHDALAHI